jgi:hypothetical protein
MKKNLLLLFLFITSEVFSQTSSVITYEGNGRCSIQNVIFVNNNYYLAIDPQNEVIVRKNTQNEIVTLDTFDDITNTSIIYRTDINFKRNLEIRFNSSGYTKIIEFKKIKDNFLVLLEFKNDLVFNNITLTRNKKINRVLVFLDKDLEVKWYKEIHSEEFIRNTFSLETEGFIKLAINSFMFDKDVFWENDIIIKGGESNTAYLELDYTGEILNSITLPRYYNLGIRYSRENFEKFSVFKNVEKTDMSFFGVQESFDGNMLIIDRINQNFDKNTIKSIGYQNTDAGNTNFLALGNKHYYANYFDDSISFMGVKLTNSITNKRNQSAVIFEVVDEQVTNFVEFITSNNLSQLKLFPFNGKLGVIAPLTNFGLKVNSTDLTTTSGTESVFFTFDDNFNEELVLKNEGSSSLSIDINQGSAIGENNEFILFGHYQSQIDFNGIKLESENLYDGYIWLTGLKDSVTTSIPKKEIEHIEFTIFPNPAKNNLSIKINSDYQLKSNLKVFNVTGQIIINTRIDNVVNTLDIESLKPGTYIIQISNKNGLASKKLIVK